MNPFATALAETAMTEMEQTAAQAAIVGGLVALGVGALVTLAIAWFVLQAIADWKIFTKAGRAGWKSIVPILAEYEEFDLCWKGSLGLLYAVITMALQCFYNYVKNPANWLVIVMGILAIIGVVLSFMQSMRLSKAFGKGAGFGWGLFLLGPLFRLILGFGGSKYVGKPEA